MNPADITDYASLKQAVTQYLLSQDLEANDVDLWIALAEDAFRNETRWRQAQFQVTGQFIKDLPVIALPADYDETDVFYLPVQGSLTQQHEMHLVSSQKLESMGNAPGLPRYYAVRGNNVFVRPIPDSDYDYALSYYRKLPPLSTIQNWIITERPILYLQKTLAEAYRYYENEDRADYWDALYERTRAAMQTADTRARWRPYSRMRPDLPSDATWKRP